VPNSQSGPAVGQFCGEHFSWLCQAGQGECQRAEVEGNDDSPRAPITDTLLDALHMIYTTVLKGDDEAVLLCEEHTEWRGVIDCASVSIVARTAVEHFRAEHGATPTRPQPSIEDDPVAKRLGIIRCCDLHGVNCEPPSELCCEYCTEANHPNHPNVDCVLRQSATGSSSPSTSGGAS